ncbi:MAG: hypothetical protein QG657_5600 [Acidobacteriota bacterium]|nr:hypothetical protein [Acidobacteriota bacterium]
MRHLTKCIFILILVCSLNLFSAEKKPFAIDDLYRLKGIGGMRISPDGNKLLFTVTESRLKEGKTNSDVFLLNLSTGETTQLTFDPGADTDPFWSTDGKKIYFISSRQDGSQLWEMDVNGGEARKLSDFYTGVSTPLSGKGPNGAQKILFTSTVFPECLEKEADQCNSCNKEKAEKLESGPVQAHMADSLLFRHWNAYRDWQYSHLFCFDLVEKKVKAITKGQVDYPAFSTGGGEYDISSDGNTVCIVSNHDKNLAHSTNQDLFLIDLNAPQAEPLNITIENKAHDGAPSFSPDGQWIGFITQRVPGCESSKKMLALYNIKSKQIKLLTEGIDNWVSNFNWAPDSRSIYFTLAEKGYTPMYRVNLAANRVEKIIERQSIASFLVTPDGKETIFLRSATGEPYEIWSCRFDQKGLKRLTSFNKKVEEEVDIRPSEEHWTVGAEGKQIHIFVVKPHAFDPNKKYPLILNIHGGPQMQWMNNFRGDWQVYPGAGYVLAYPNPHGSTGYGQQFTDAISGDWNGRVMEDIDKVAQYLAKLPYVDSERMGAMGWSWGGYAIMWIEGHNKYFKALASMMGTYNTRSMYSGTEELWFPEWDMNRFKPWEKPEFYNETSPSTYVKEFKTPCLIITGERDYRVPYHNSVEFFTDLQEMGVASLLIIFKNDGHWPNGVKSMPVYYNAHLEWFHKYLNGDKAPYDTEALIRNMAFAEKK